MIISLKTAKSQRMPSWNLSVLCDFAVILNNLDIGGKGSEIALKDWFIRT